MAYIFVQKLTKPHQSQYFKNKMTFFKVKQIQFMEIYRNVLYRIYSIDIFILFKS
jgi:hypothetical protein